MADKTITQRIALEGGKEVRNELEQIGQAGKKAFSELGAAVNVESVFTKASHFFEKIGAQFSKIGEAAGNVKEHIGRLGEAFETTAKRVGIMTGAIGLTATAIGAYTSAVSNSIERSRQYADALGLTIEEFEKLAGVARLNDIGVDQFSKALLKMANAAKANDAQLRNNQNAFLELDRQFAKGDVSATDYLNRVDDLNFKIGLQDNAFKKLGVSLLDASGKMKTPKQLLFDLADAFKAMEPGLEKTALLTEVFGSKNSRFIAVINGGSDALRRYSAEVERVAPPLTKLQEIAGSELNEAFDKLGLVTENIQRQLTLLFGPSITAAVEAFSEFLIRNRATFVIWASDIASQVQPVIQDVIALLEGRDKDVKAQWILTARDRFVQFGEAVAKIAGLIGSAISVILSALDKVAKVINSVFGTQLTGPMLAVGLVVAQLTGLFGLLGAAIGAIVSIVSLVGAAFAGVGAAISLPVIALTVLGVAIGAFVVWGVAKLWELIGGWEGVKAAFVKGVDSIVDALKGGVEGWKQIFASGLDALKQSAQETWDSIVASATEFWGEIKGAWDSGIGVLDSVWEAIKQKASGAWDVVKSNATSLWDKIKAAWDGGSSAISGAWDSVKDSATSTWDAVKESGQSLFADLASGWAAGVAGTNSVWDTLKVTIQGVWDSIKEAAANLWTDIAAAWQGAIDNMDSMFQSLGATAVGVFQSIADSAAASVAAIQSLKDSVSSVSNNSSDNSASFAGGGVVRGPGTSRSDSIRAWLSDGEFVVRADAVQRYGVGFMHALNSLRLPDDLFSGIMPAPRFADGGLVVAPTGRPVTLNIGGEVFAGLTAPDQTIARLERFATHSAARAGGRKPSWHRG